MMELRPRKNTIDEILAIIDKGLAESDALAEAYKKNFIETDQLPEVYLGELAIQASADYL